MKAYELTATVTDDGKLELPDFRLSSPGTVKVIVLVPEPDDGNEDFSEASFQQSWEQAMVGETVPLSELWENTESV